MKSMRSKRIWLTAFLATAFMLFGAGVSTVDSVEVSAANTVTAESVGLVMDKGAGVRLGSADGNNGIRFVLTMDKTEYSSLMEKVGTDEDDLYSEISFGMLITKASYVTDAKDLTVENVFGDDAVFEWKPEGADENWTVSDGKTLVVNQTFGYLGIAEDYENDYVGFASLVNLHDYNLTQEFIGRGYMKYTAKGGSVSYRMADYYEDIRSNNMRSMVYVAQKAAEDPQMADYKDTLSSLYINHSAVQAQTVDVTVKHHKLDVHGEEVGVETETVSGQKIGASVTATALTNEGWIYNEAKSTVSGVVYANGKTVLDLYYEQDPATVYDWYQVGTPAAATNTLTLDEVVTGGIVNDEVELELSFDLLSGTMPRLKFYFLTAGGAQITDPATNGWITVADCYDETTGTYKFKTYFKWNSASWDIGKVFLQLEDGEYQLGVNVVSVKVLSNYDFKISRATTTTYNLPEAVTGAVRYDKAVVTLALNEVIGDLTQVRLELLNKSGTTIANNNEKYYTLADCATGEENTYAMTISFPWAGGDWDITAIRLIVDAETYVVGINVKSIEIVPVEYDVKFTANKAHEQQNYTLESPIKAVKGDKIEIVFTITSFYGTVNGASTDIYFYLNDALGNVAVTPGWLELTDILVEGTTYKAVADVTANVEIYSIKTQVGYAQMSGLTFDSITVLNENYDFKMDNEASVTYELSSPISVTQYNLADVTVKLDILSGDVTQMKVELLNASGEVVADNDGVFFNLADCATGEENIYNFAVLATFEVEDCNVTAIRFTLDGDTYVVGGYVEKITATDKNYDFVIDKKSYYIYTPAAATTGAVRYDKVEISLELTELVGDLTKLHIQVKNNVGTVVANNNDKYFTLADCATGEDNTYKFVLTFPWANGNWDVTSIVFTVGDTAHVVGFNVKSIEIVPVEYDFKMNQQTTVRYTLPESVKGAVRYDSAIVTLELVELYGDLKNVTINLWNKAKNDYVAKSSSFAIDSYKTGVANTYAFTLSFPWATGDWTVTDIELVIGSGFMVGVNVKSIEIQEVAYQLEYSFASGSQKKVYTFDKVAGGKQNGYVKLTFDVAVFVGTLTNIQFNLCTDTAAATTVANSNKAWAEDGTKITSSGGQISMSNLTGKKTVTIVTTFPWANGNWDLQSIQLQLYGTNLQAGVSNIQVELMPDFVPAA